MRKAFANAKVTVSLAAALGAGCATEYRWDVYNQHAGIPAGSMHYKGEYQPPCMKGESSREETTRLVGACHKVVKQAAYVRTERVGNNYVQSTNVGNAAINVIVGLGAAFPGDYLEVNTAAPVSFVVSKEGMSFTVDGKTTQVPSDASCMFESFSESAVFSKKDNRLSVVRNEMSGPVVVSCDGQEVSLPLVIVDDLLTVTGRKQKAEGEQKVACNMQLGGKK